MVTPPGTQSSITIGTAGIYLFIFTLQISYGTVPTYFYCEMTGTNTTPVAYGTASVLQGSNLSITGSTIVSCTASNYTLNVSYGGGAGMAVNSSSIFKAIRIA